ncbi:MAG: M28 family peptidase [Planctomycetota bacterium]
MRSLAFCVIAALVPGQASEQAYGQASGQASGQTPSELSSLQKDLQYLSSDELLGRSVTDESIDVAADYVAKRMSEIGLKSDVVDGTPFQPVDVALEAQVGSVENNRVVFRNTETQDEVFEATLPDGMSPLSIGSSNGDVTGRIVFVGYGITAPLLGFDDYADVDVNGATVIVIRKEPRLSDPDSPFDGTRSSRHALFTTKVNNAISQGAAAMILVNDPASVRSAVLNVRSQISQEENRRARITQQMEALPEALVNARKKLQNSLGLIDQSIKGLENDITVAERGVLDVGAAGDRPQGRQMIPVVSMARDVIDELLQADAGKSLAEYEAEIDAKTAPASFELTKHSIELQSEIKPTVANTKNVLGILPGRGALAGQTIVVGAHYDHVGMGGYGSLAPGTVAIHNGADDNASGTVTMLEVATRMNAELKDVDSHRQILFMAFTGEERGLIGSQHYVKDPVIPLANTVAMVNLDMVGRLRDNELTVYGTGSANGFDELIDRANEKGKFKLEKVPSGYGPSDHQSFYQSGVPVLFFFTGLHNDYHRPSDDFDKINFKGLSRITDIVSEVTLELATDPQRPEYAETEKSGQN